MRIDLSSLNWQFRGHWPYTPLFGRSMETGAPMGAVTHWMPARVPGCVITDLLANGVIEDPYYESNSLKCEWVAARWWVYRTEFTLDEAYRGQDIALVFLGVDYKCHIFLNGEKLCEHEGMYEPIRLDVTGKARFGSPNALEVVLESAPDEMGQIGHTSRVHTQTSRFGYKWDYGTRLIHAGIWQEVFLEATPGARIANTHIVTTVRDGTGIVDVGFELTLADGQYRLEAELSLDGAVAARQSADIDGGQQRAELSLPVASPRLWWPAGYGGQPLYQLKARLWRGGLLCDEYDAEAGIRTLEYEHNDGAPDALPYIVKINGRRIYIRGVNISPLDHMIGSVGEREYARLTELVVGLNANLIRVWGGGVTEKEAFYRLCDRLGILVWQEFNQSSSGIDNVPPKDAAFLCLLKRNATASLLARRNHVCLAFWNGGNELMDEAGVPSTYDDANIAMLRALAEELDPQRLFLPTSASGPREFLDVSAEAQGGNHDVHGPWQYQGAARHYEMYNLSDSLLHSEFGTDAFTNPTAVPRFLSEGNRAPSSVKDNLVWRHHGEWWDTTARDRELFGSLDSLEAMIWCSQYIQAEGLRYSVESNRRRAFRNSGSIIWQLNEPWPNLFCTCLVDYYARPKTAYWYVKRAYAPLALSLRYEKLIHAPGSRFLAEAWVADNDGVFAGTVAYRVLDMTGRLHHSGSFAVNCCGRHSEKAGGIDFAVGDFPAGIFFVELSAVGGAPALVNRYMFSCGSEPAFSGLFQYRDADVALACDDDLAVTAQNRGRSAAVAVRVCDGDGHEPLEDSGFILFPGESRTVRCTAPVGGALRADWLNR